VQLLLLAFEAALYPTLLAAVVILLNQPRRRRLITAYLLGGLTISIGLGLAIIAALKDSGQLNSSSSGLSWRADLVVGGLALLSAVALATRADERLRERRRGKRPPKEEQDREPWSQRLLARGSAPIVFFAGLAINVPGAAYLVALKDIAAGHHSTGTDVLLVLLFNAIMFMLAEIPLLGLVFAPERTDELVGWMDRWLSANGRRIAIGLCVVLGVFLIARGIAHSA
jgi:Sap, sulfolipid-1-addressing protein